MTRILLIAASFFLSPALTAKSGTQDFEAEAKRAFEEMAPVGMAVAIIEDGEVVLLEGYGKLAVDTNQPVGPDTVFPIHSMTKSFVAAALAILVDEDKISWSDPVVKYIPEFETSDPYITQKLTIRDLLVHNSGLALGAGDLLSWPDQTATTAETIAALRHLPFENGFRESFTYDNILYTVAGEIIARQSGITWSQFISSRFFGPLGMTSCSTSTATAKPFQTAVQHSRAAGAAPVPRRDIVLNDDPAGSISCSVRDIARWADFQLGGGANEDGLAIVSSEQMRVMHRPVVPLGAPNFMRELGDIELNNYALGWFVNNFAGTIAVEHGGLGPGGATNMVLLPRQNSAVVVLTNDLRPAVFPAFHLADRIVRGEAASDWIGWFVNRERERANSANREQVSAERPREASIPPSRLPSYAGTYCDAWYGTIMVTHHPDGLNLHLTRSKLLNGPLIPWDGDTFLARWPDRSLEADALVTFLRDEAGEIKGMSLRAQSDRTDFSYDYQHLAPVRSSSCSMQ